MSGATGTTIYTVTATATENLFGRSVTGIGDFDGDGVGDFAVGAPKDNSTVINGGRALVYRGAVADDCSLVLVGIPQVGQTIALCTQDGQQVPAQICYADDEKISLDMNHPLAGKSLTFEIEVVGISATQTQENDGCGCNCDCSSGSC